MADPDSTTRGGREAGREMVRTDYCAGPECTACNGGRAIIEQLTPCGAGD